MYLLKKGIYMSNKNNNRDDFTQSVKDKLAQRVNYICSNPDCCRGTSAAATDKNKAINAGVAAHICAAAPGGKRYDPGMTRDERRDISNGIWLCSSCSTIIDRDENKYTVELLKKWKEIAENRALEGLVKPIYGLQITDNKVSQDLINDLVKAINQNKVAEYKDDTIDEIKRKIETLYKEASQIINTEDALIEISFADKEILKQIYNRLKALDFYYKNNENKEAKLYYHNLFVILTKSNYEDGLKYYFEMPEFARENDITKYFYALVLIENDKIEEAKEIVEELYFNRKFENSFETLIKIYFLLKDYEKVIEQLSGCKKEKFDRYGFLAAIYILSKNQKKQYSENELIKLNNSKFKTMPLYYSCTAQLLYRLDKRKKRYKEQFRKGINCLGEKDIIAIDIMCKESIELQLEDDMISFLENKDLTLVLRKRFIELLTRKSELTNEQIKIIEENLNVLEDTNIDKNYLNGKVAEEKGKFLEAISFYRSSFENSDNNIAGLKYIQLAIRNRAQIDENIILEIAKINNVTALMLVVDAYNYIRKYDKALEWSYKALYLAQKNIKKREVLKQLWYTSLLKKNKNLLKVDNVTNECVVVLENSKNQIILLLEDDEYFKENDYIEKAKIVRTASDIGIELLNLKEGDQTYIFNETYKVVKVLNKYTYFVQNAFSQIENDKHVELFRTENEDAKEAINQLTQKMIEVNKECNRRLDVYQENKNIPLSALLNEDFGFEEYAKLINTLLLEPERVLLAGETLEVDCSNGFVLDISSIIVLSILDMLDLIPEEVCKKIYITTSLKNKFKYFYESLIDKHNETENLLYLCNNDQLSLNEIPVINQIKFWNKVNKCIEKFIIRDVEAEKDELLDDKVIRGLDKVQFDLIALAKCENLPYISDDLMIRKISNYYEVNNSNSLQLIKLFSTNYEKYIEYIIKYAKHNYIYTLHENTFSDLLKWLYENFTEENKKMFLSIIESVLENKASIEYYVPLLLNIINNVKEIQYIEIQGIVFESLVISFFVNDICELIKIKCNDKGIDIDKIK